MQIDNQIASHRWRLRRANSYHIPDGTRSEADMDRRRIPADWVENDPSPTLAVHCGNGFNARFEPYSKSSFESIQCCPLSLGADMRRREFFAFLVARPCMAARRERAAAGKLPTIGYLGPTTPAVESQWFTAFVQRLRELGWIEGRTVAIEYR